MENNNFKITNTDKHIKGYIFDSLVYRYMKARDAQLAAEKELYLLKNSDNLSSQDRYKDSITNNAIRDKRRFIEILDEVIGEHD